MTERQRKTIIKLKLEIEGLKLKYKERGRIISKRIDRKRRFNCFICGRKWEDNFVCANCVNDDLTKLNERIIILEGTKSVEEDFKKAKEKGYKIYLQNN